jgi:hypothetical protein
LKIPPGGYRAWNFLELAVLAKAQRIGVMLGAIEFGGAGLDELAAALGHVGQALLPGRNRGGEHFGFACFNAADLCISVYQCLFVFITGFFAVFFAVFLCVSLCFVGGWRTGERIDGLMDW